MYAGVLNMLLKINAVKLRDNIIRQQQWRKRRILGGEVFQRKTGLPVIIVVVE